MMKRILISSFLVMILLGCEPTQISTEYKTYEQAEEMVQKGWVPPGLPRETTNIYETHNLDTNKGNGVFTIKQEYVLPFYNALDEVEKGFVLEKEVLDVKNWDKKEVYEQIQDDELLLGFEDGIVYAISKDGTVYYWIH